MLKENRFNNETLLNRICDIYGFTQKLQLANHFKIAASSLQNRYKRGNISYDFAVLCALETGARLSWLMSGEGAKFDDKAAISTDLNIELYHLSEGQLISDGMIKFDEKFFNKPLNYAMAIRYESDLYILDKQSSLIDGLWLVDMDSTISLREVALLPGKKLHISGGKIPFECEFDAINLVGRIVGKYTTIT